MGKIIKNLAVVAGILVISTAIFFLVNENKDFRDDVLDRSLRLLGSQLIAMIPEGNDQEQLRDQWQEFSDKAKKGELPQENVERVAVGILNASNHKEDFSPGDAEAILNLALKEQGSKAAALARETNTWAWKASNPKPVDKTTVHRSWSEFGKDLEAACEFNQRVQETCEDDQKRKVIVKHFRYDWKDGIKISADLDLKHRLLEKELSALDKHLGLLERQNMVDWQQNLAMHLDHEKMNLKLQLDSLRVIIRSGNIKLNRELQELLRHEKQQEALRTLEKLQYWQAVSPEYIEKVVHESLANVEVKVERH